LSEALIKRISGGDTVTARFLYGEFFDFRPEFKAFLATNHKPQIRGTDEGIWRRIKLIPFDVRFTDEQKDKALPQKLKAEAAGILRWAVEGCLEWQRIGLCEPKDVLAATSDYRQEMDVLAAYLDERCVISPALSVPAGGLYADYQRWCKENGEYAVSQKRLGQRLRERGFESGRNERHRFWHGLGLQASEAASSYYERDEEAEVSY
jgi:putative DNA primase/helicase